MFGQDTRHDERDSLADRCSGGVGGGEGEWQYKRMFRWTSHCSPRSPLTEAVALEGVVEVLWLVTGDETTFKSLCFQPQ